MQTLGVSIVCLSREPNLRQLQGCNYQSRRADIWLFLRPFNYFSSAVFFCILSYLCQMAWPYHFIDLTKEEQHQRRVLLDRYGVYAQLSAVVPIVVFQLYRLGIWVYSERSRSQVDYSEVPSSPSLKKRRNSSSGTFIQKWRRARWWLGHETRLGVRGQLIGAGIWLAWLLFLCVHKTGDGMLFSLQLSLSLLLKTQ